MTNDSNWLAARLIPISGIGGIEEQERRATSALLAVLSAVREFNRALLKPMGAPAGTVEAFCEVPFQLEDGRKVRLDGVLRVRRGNRTWTLLVEVKTGTNSHTNEQIESYLDVVRQERLDGLLTISNDISATVFVRGKKYSRIPMHHLSWFHILATAKMVRDHTGVSDPDQAWILSELIRYLEYSGSGALAFEDMGEDWVAVRTGIRQGTIKSPSGPVEQIARRWDQLIQYLCLNLGSRLGSDVRPALSRKESDNPDLRSATLAKELVASGILTAAIRIPNTVGPLHLRADLRAMQLTLSTDVAAPDLKRAAARISWLLRQLKDAPPTLFIEIAHERLHTVTGATLETLREDVKPALADGRLPREFRVLMTSPVGANRKAGRSGFITNVAALVDHFYTEIVQQLRPWSPPAPQLKGGEPIGQPEPVDRDTAPTVEVEEIRAL